MQRLLHYFAFLELVLGAVLAVAFVVSVYDFQFDMFIYCVRGDALAVPLELER